MHWQYHRYGSGYGASHLYIDTKELIECTSVNSLKKQLKEKLSKRNLKKDAIKSVRLVLKTRKARLTL